MLRFATTSSSQSQCCAQQCRLVQLQQQQLQGCKPKFNSDSSKRLLRSQSKPKQVLFKSSKTQQRRQLSHSISTTGKPTFKHEPRLFVRLLLQSHWPMEC
mmetsp:Transcript_4493/g.8992  ORF Transcript_4493/g.8992 Transcript_4493/m.8992 type:complete len:100 (-) Transcript_4493:38-337(-)